jgi:hypothetical protein
VPRIKTWVWHGLDETEPIEIRQGAGGGWQHKPEREEPPVIHLLGGKSHEITKPGRERIGFGKG